MRYFFISIIGLVLMGCDSVYQETVVITTKAPQLEIFNDTKDPVYFLIIETEFSHLIDLADPCIDFRPNLPVGSQISIPYNSIPGMHKNARSVWFMWTNCSGQFNSETIKLF